MESEDFEGLFDEEMALLEPSSQGSLIGAAADLATDHENYATESLDSNPSSGIHCSFQDVAASDLLPINTVSFTDTVHQNDFRPPERLMPRPYPNAAVIDKIEAVFHGIVDAMLHDKQDLSITLKVRQSTVRPQSDEQDVQTRRICFPGKTEEEAWRFAVVLRILELMHEALRNDVVISKRDIYYRDPALFGSQSHVDRYVDDIAHTFGISRADLNVTAAAKGLLAGAVTFHRRDGSILTASCDQEGILVPTLKDILSVDMSLVKWIVVIEKEASFRSIVGSAFWTKISTRGIIITGKGYPDLSTRAMLHFLGTPSTRNGFSSAPVYGLADFDPDGIAILSIYKHGSRALAHENKDLVVPQLQWLGLRCAHLQIGCSRNLHTAQGLLVLTKRDRAKAISVLRQVESAEEDEEAKLQKRELQNMLMLDVKAELQLLDAVPNGMVDLLESRLGML